MKHSVTEVTVHTYWYFHPCITTSSAKMEVGLDLAEFSQLKNTTSEKLFLHQKNKSTDFYR